MFIHTVYFWLKPDAPAGEREALAKDCRDLLAGIPGVVHLWVGRPAMTPRTVVDNSYDVGLCIVLTDAAAHDPYQSHPDHAEFIRRHEQYWQRVQVYDFSHQAS